ncbi:MAG: hypothetical protein AB7O62_19655 [Pirellulales bacterium]
MKRHLTISALAVLALLLFSNSHASACPMCKAALSGQEGGGDLVQGFMWSIIFMLSMPFTLLGTFCGCMYLAVRKARAAQAEQPLAAADSTAETSGETVNV